ncbi:MAG: helix-turn-helix transcriptional regulator [Actinobacteria bacterium]|nr:helix-turn-helix transcriptional regulator [Actinomycetota bacterium]
MALSKNGDETVLCPPEPVPRTAQRPSPDQNGRGAIGGGSLSVDWERLSRTYIHPLRISILEVLGIDGGRVLSPTDLSRELRHDLSNTDYHVRQLAKAGLIVLAYRRPGLRGSSENFYRLA